MNTNEPRRVIVDTNIVIYLSREFKDGFYERPLKHASPLYRIMKKVVDNELELYVTPEVVREIKKGWHYDNGRAEEFMNKYCTILTFNHEENKIIEKLTERYGNRKPLAFEDAQGRNSKNYSDALIMAQSTVAGMDLITNNTKHFCHVENIQQANEIEGLEPVRPYSDREFVHHGFYNNSPEQ